MDRISEYSRLLASIRGLMLHFLIFQHRLMQVVDFHDYFSYFHMFLGLAHHRPPSAALADCAAAGKPGP
jgi:hypothetical protein